MVDRSHFKLVVILEELLRRLINLNLARSVLSVVKLREVHFDDRV